MSVSIFSKLWIFLNGSKSSFDSKFLDIVDKVNLYGNRYDSLVDDIAYLEYCYQVNNKNSWFNQNLGLKIDVEKDPSEGIFIYEPTSRVVEHPIILASILNILPLVEFLVKIGVDVNTRDTGSNVLGYSLYYRSFTVAKFFLKQEGLNIDNSIHKFYQNYEKFDELIDILVTKNYNDKDLSFFNNVDFVEIFELLVKKNPAVNISIINKVVKLSNPYLLEFLFDKIDKNLLEKIIKRIENIEENPFVYCLNSDALIKILLENGFDLYERYYYSSLFGGVFSKVNIIEYFKKTNFVAQARLEDIISLDISLKEQKELNKML